MTWTPPPSPPNVTSHEARIRRGVCRIGWNGTFFPKKTVRATASDECQEPQIRSTGLARTQNGHLALANLTIDLPGDDETVVSLDRFKHLLRSISCTNKTMTVGFTSDKAYDHVRQTWQWLNSRDMHKLVVVAGAGECGWNPTRIPFYASTIVFNDTANSVSLTGHAIAWKEFQNYELNVGNYNPVPNSRLAARLARTRLSRDLEESMSLPFDIPLPFPSGQLNTPPGVPDLALTWFCNECGTKGSFDFGFHIETKLGIPQGASISLTPNSVSTTVNSRVAIQADLTESLGHEWEIGGIPIGGISIPGGILDVGPAITFSLGYSVGPLQGSAGVTSGVTATIPDGSELEIQLLDPDVESSGWEAEVQTEKVVLDARVTGDIQIYVKASIELSAEALGQGFEAGINLKPYAGAGLTAQASTDEVCADSGTNFGVMVLPKAGIALNAAVAKASEPEDPLVEAVIASVTASGLPTYCAAFGEEASSTPVATPTGGGSVPSSSPSSTPTAAPVPQPTLPSSLVVSSSRPSTSRPTSTSTASTRTPPSNPIPLPTLTSTLTSTSTPYIYAPVAPSSPPQSASSVITPSPQPTNPSSSYPITASSPSPSSSQLFRREGYVTKIF
ncbi:uncharacterized protein BDV17DRAFT_290364 [Aspergillus undulatus]|uniref:uncharacterized protein n=1 Tax=Aspergillus undulatus TaxID=1810928 RepID=UPI003CCDFD74